MTPIGFDPHDHSACISSTLAQADAHCAQHKLNLTPIRRRALEILLAEHRALGAYDLLGHFAAEGLGTAPPVAYRALDFLTSAGFAHKIEGMNAYIACAHIGSEHSPAFLICTACKSVAEAESETAAHQLDDAAQTVGFRIERTIVEALGICPACQETA